MESPPHAPVREGDILANKYRVEEVLGVGGMGIVVAARHIELDQKVALKFLLPAAMDSEEMVSRFVNEGRAVVKLKSEHIAKVTDVGRLESGAPYIVMEFLHGHDLGAVIREHGAREISEATSFVLQACEAIAEAHASKIIHRDLKPQNLFLTRGLDGEPLVKVLDFGISKTMSTQAPGGPVDPMALTRTQSMLGSPLYMSPEQMRSSKNVDERSDVWSLGVILFELLTGKVPYEAENVAELVFKIAENAPPDPRELRPDVPEALANVVLACLRKDVEKRLPNVAELAAAIEPFAYERERGMASRIAAVLGGRMRERSLSFSDTSSPRITVKSGKQTPIPGTTPLKSGVTADFPSPLAATPLVAAKERGSDASPASDAWGGTQATTSPIKRTKKTPWVPIAIAGAAIVLVGGAAVGMSRGHHVDVPPEPSSRGLANTTLEPESSAPIASAVANPPTTAVPPPTSTSTAAARPVVTQANITPPATSNHPQPKPSVTTSSAPPPKPLTPPTASGGFIPVRE